MPQCAPGDHSWVYSEERQLWNMSTEQFYEQLWISVFIPLSSFLTASCEHSNEGLFSTFLSSYCSCKCPCLHVGKVLVCECRCWELMMEVFSLMYCVSLIPSQIGNSLTRSVDPSHMGYNEWLVRKKAVLKDTQHPRKLSYVNTKSSINTCKE